MPEIGATDPVSGFADGAPVRGNVEEALMCSQNAQSQHDCVENPVGLLEYDGRQKPDEPAQTPDWWCLMTARISTCAQTNGRDVHSA